MDADYKAQEAVKPQGGEAEADKDPIEGRAAQDIPHIEDLQDVGDGELMRSIPRGLMPVVETTGAAIREAVIAFLKYGGPGIAPMVKVETYGTPTELNARSIIEADCTVTFEDGKRFTIGVEELDDGEEPSARQWAEGMLTIDEWVSPTDATQGGEPHEQAAGTLRYAPTFDALTNGPYMDIPVSELNAKPRKDMSRQVYEQPVCRLCGMKVGVGNWGEGWFANGDYVEGHKHCIEAAHLLPAHPRVLMIQAEIEQARREGKTVNLAHLSSGDIALLRTYGKAMQEKAGMTPYVELIEGLSKPSVEYGTERAMRAIQGQEQAQDEQQDPPSAVGVRVWATSYAQGPAKASPITPRAMTSEPDETPPPKSEAYNRGYEMGQAIGRALTEPIRQAVDRLIAWHKAQDPAKEEARLEITARGPQSRPAMSSWAMYKATLRHEAIDAPPLLPLDVWAHHTGEPGCTCNGLTEPHAACAVDDLTNEYLLEREARWDAGHAALTVEGWITARRIEGARYYTGDPTPPSTIRAYCMAPIEIRKGVLDANDIREEDSPYIEMPADWPVYMGYRAHILEGNRELDLKPGDAPQPLAYRDWHGMREANMQKMASGEYFRGEGGGGIDGEH